ncbi:hypothetical protein [Parasitella parasitica]|uniref:Arrestin C-terminal-like domain-containing protein n=1 Tax=Parasitella parasitica TaxID=35722 RepID=A0A0B7NV20_9FUNG|nr:hypothetical protein [Parasitella parasitica]
MSHHLKIYLENTTVILQGSPEVSVGGVLRGCLLLNVKEAIKIRSITMNLLGKIKFQWSERNHLHKKEFTVLDNNWSFLSHQKKVHVLTPDVYKYPFEFILPGNLPESIDSHSYGSVLYKLKAIVDRPAFSSNFIDRQTLRIVRHCIPPYHMSSLPMQITNEWANKIDYRITVPKKIYSRGEQIPIDFSLVPKPNSAGLHVRYLSCFLKEYTTFVLGATDSNTCTESRIIRFFRDESFPSEGLHWNKSVFMTVPHSFDSIQCDTQNQFFKIEHKLKFTMSLINGRGELSELRATLPVNIVARRIEQAQEEDELPAYENAWRSAPYSPLPFLDASCPHSPIDDSYPITPSHPNHGNGMDDYFSCRPTSNLPSYYSLAPPASIDENNNLPSYENVCCHRE